MSAFENSTNTFVWSSQSVHHPSGCPQRCFYWSNCGNVATNDQVWSGMLFTQSLIKLNNKQSCSFYLLVLVYCVIKKQAHRYMVILDFSRRDVTFYKRQIVLLRILWDRFCLIIRNSKPEILQVEVQFLVEEFGVTSNLETSVLFEGCL